MVVDACTYNGERELWDIHYQSLKDYVDEFIVLEFSETFSGVPKDKTFPVEDYPGVTYYFLRETDYEKYRGLAETSPNTKGASHWTREFMQKEAIRDTLTHLKDADMVFIGDVDEVWDPKVLTWHWFPVKLKLKVYTYYLNNRSSEQFAGTLVAPYYMIKDRCLNHLRSFTTHSKYEAGWHFTSMGGAVSLRKKLEDSYTQESYATPHVLENLAYNIEQSRDFLGRAFTYQRDESEWPEFLKKNREKYTHLLT